MPASHRSIAAHVVMMASTSATLATPMFSRMDEVLHEMSTATMGKRTIAILSKAANCLLFPFIPASLLRLRAELGFVDAFLALLVLRLHQDATERLTTLDVTVCVSGLCEVENLVSDNGEISGCHLVQKS